MKRVLWFAIVVIAGFAFVHCAIATENIEPLSGALTFDKVSVAVGEPLKATLESSGGTPPYRVSYVSWRIIEEGFGEIVGESGGTVDGNTYSLTPTRGNQCRLIIQLEDSGNRDVFVETPWIPVFVRILVTSVSLGEDIYTLRQGETSIIQPHVIPYEVTNSTMFWSISDTSIATIDQTGLVTGIMEGEATITATTLDGSNLSAQATVTVLPHILVDSVQLSGDQELNVGGTVKLTASTLPENAGDKTLTWSTSNASVATVVDGLVTATGYGSATITATAVGGASASCVVTVDPAVEQLRAVAYGLGVTTTSSGRYITFSGGAQYGTAPYNATYRLLSNNSELTSKSMITNGIEELSYSIGSSIVNATFTVTVDVTDANGHMSSARTSAQIYVNGWNMSFTELEETPILVKLTGISMELHPRLWSRGASIQCQLLSYQRMQQKSPLYGSAAMKPSFQ